MTKYDSLEEAIRMLVRVAGRLRKEGIELRFTLESRPVPVEHASPSWKRAKSPRVKI